MTLSSTTKPYSEPCQKTKGSNSEQRSILDHGDLLRRVLEVCQCLIGKPGVYSHLHMKSVGFQYTNHGDNVICLKCGLNVSGWTLDMNPLTIHKQRSPTCPFVRSISSTDNILPSTNINFAASIPSLTSNEHLLIGSQTDTNRYSNLLIEVDILKQIRKRTFSHWSHQTSPSTSQMITAGFFSCNVADRVICIYCNLICQQWTSNVDDPCQIHQTLSPTCPYVIAHFQTSSPLIIDEHLTTDRSSNTTVHSAVVHPAYIETAKRCASFASWPNEKLPSVDDLVKNGFFYSGNETTVICFYCNGSLKKLSVNNNPIVEHVRWFPHCTYAKQQCGDDLYSKIQESRRIQQDIDTNSLHDSSNRRLTNSGEYTSNQLIVPDEHTLSRLVAARLDLPVSQRLRNQHFKQSIIERCWEDQLRLKHNDFVDDCDLVMACMLLQKQIDHIDGKKQNIIIPSITMRNLLRQDQSDSLLRDNIVVANANEPILERIRRMSIPTAGGMKDLKLSVTENAEQNLADNRLICNSCATCITKEWHLALLPCHHLPLEQNRDYTSSKY